ncbi:MAG: rod shape-determining protein MreD [Gammaproteobacteria bacterium]|nr:MAG: rod shape-determining protein MreD [Gammaproteobacteria bacterium]
MNPEKIKDEQLGKEHYIAQDVYVPASNWFVATSLIVALILNFLPLQGDILLLRPDFLALTLAYWNINYPHKMGMSIAFGMGLLMDVGNAGVMGQHALAYSVVIYLTQIFGRRLRLFNPLQQAPQITLILLMMQWIIVVVAVSSDALLPDWQYYLSIVAGALLWTPLSYLLKWLLKQKPDPNAL